MNLFSIDLEEWYHYEYLMRKADKSIKLLPKCVPPLLDLLRKRDTQATFFVLAQEAEAQPEVIDQIKAEGHEIASHGYDHTQLGAFTQIQFEDDIKKSLAILKKVANIKPEGYRAPYFSLTHRQPWVLDVLRKNGFTYDSSLFPVKTPLYGEPRSPLTPYRPSKDDMFKHDPKASLVEFPASIYTGAIKRLPFLGGFYMRSLPYPVLKHMLKSINKQGRPGVMYFHPWEPYTATLRPQIPAHHKIISFIGNRSFLSKLDRLLKDFEWGTYKEAARRIW